MGKYEVYVFIIHCFLASSVQVNPNVAIEPFGGIGVHDIEDLMDRFLEKVLRQPTQPINKKIATSNKIRDEGASAIIRISDLEASSPIDAIKSTEDIVLACRDLLALRQLQRGFISGFLSIQTDVSPVQLYAHLRRPFPILRKVQNIPIFDNESDIYSRLMSKVSKYPLLQIYLSLYADTVAYSDTFVTEISNETRLMKTWSLLEAMASAEGGSKKQKVKNLFVRYQISSIPNYRNHIGKDLIDIAYHWRNIVAHCGGCKAATKLEDVQFSRDFQEEFEYVLEDLSQSCRFLLHMYANSLP